MSPDALAALHAAAFVHDRSWTAAEFNDLLDTPFVQLFTRTQGFALTRTLAGESELLTLAVHPQQRLRGIARALLADWLAEINGTADTAFLEVASDNAAAIALYRAQGFEQVSTRRGYYARSHAPAADALIFRRDLTEG